MTGLSFVISPVFQHVQQNACLRRRLMVSNVLSEKDRQKVDKSPDAFFYNTPRLVRHADASWHASLTDLYRSKLPENGSALDLMSSWVSHYPEEMKFQKVVATGMNREELSQNTVLSSYVVHDLNADPRIPFDDSSFDAVTCALSVQYLQYPGVIFDDILRVLKPRGVAIFSFSNRMFFTKAVKAWRDRSGRGRVNLVKGYFKAATGFSQPTVVSKASPLVAFAPVLSLFNLPYGGDPFYAVVAYKIQEPTAEEKEAMSTGNMEWVLATGLKAEDLRSMNP